MKKIVVYIFTVLLITIITISGTYAFIFVNDIGNENSVTTDASKFDIIYRKGKTIGNKIKLTNEKIEEQSTTVEIRITDDSIDGTANLYIQIENITEDFASEALNWEVYKTINGEESFVSSGNFENTKSGDKLYIATGQQLSTDNTIFTIYIWLNGNIAGNEVTDDTFKGHIGAETDKITGNLG